MCKTNLLAAVSLLALPLAAGEAVAQDGGYRVIDLLAPCVDADNDARDGAEDETECEQYLQGFVDALSVTSQLDADHGICLPEQNLRDEIRWAFMRWVHGDYSDRIQLPAGEGVMAAIQENMACSG